jgi:hypothetical protein
MWAREKVQRETVGWEVDLLVADVRRGLVLNVDLEGVHGWILV